MNAVAVTPARTREQRLASLALANRIRIERAVVKRELKGGTLRVGGLLADPPACVMSMKVVALLASLPKFGRVKAARLLRECQISESKTVGGLSLRQRRVLADALERVMVRPSSAGLIGVYLATVTGLEPVIQGDGK